MRPSMYYELLLAAAIILIPLLITFFLKGRWRKNGVLAIFFTVAAVIIFFIGRPYWVDYQISERTELLEEYLIDTYPEAEWKITSIDHRNVEMAHINPYYLNVSFSDEAEVTYYYFVDRNGEVRQDGFGHPEIFSSLNLKYKEDAGGD
ncbi:hypothetical protein [Evansella clarkii]|uniref:hypothetical protein n=1 Tax=Evansella clarkii TaxID=79879 RepID=UPI000997D2F3|nr:hypothetical protein [Evansella clarkii]